MLHGFASLNLKTATVQVVSFNYNLFTYLRDDLFRSQCILNHQRQRLRNTHFSKRPDLQPQDHDLNTT